MFNMIKNPSATAARAIENALINQSLTQNKPAKLCYKAAARTISLVVFPIILSFELFLKRVPKMLFSCLILDRDKAASRFVKVQKFALALLMHPFNVFAPDATSVFFLKSKRSPSEVRPFGVEKVFGKDSIHRAQPKNLKELLELVKTAKSQGKQISIVGSGFSQGIQTIPHSSNHLLIDMSLFNHIKLSSDLKSVKAGSGATWEMVQQALNLKGKSAIVKQASDPFSIGGSIGINCHGWAHEAGALSSSVRELEVITADGELKKLTKDDELFGCFFGTLGYFGIIVSATLAIEDNTELVSSCQMIETKDFNSVYKKQYLGKNIPLFYGRLDLNNVAQKPLQKVGMVAYHQTNSSTSTITESFKFEPKYGARIERIFLQAVGHLNDFFAKHLIRFFWKREKKLMMKQDKMTRNEILHPPINSLNSLKASNLHSQWLQEYFVTPKTLAKFIDFLGSVLDEHQVRLINASIRPVPQDNISILPYAPQDCYAVVLCFAQEKTPASIEKTKSWIKKVNSWLLHHRGRFYQAYMPFANRQEFEICYGKKTIKRLLELKNKYDPDHLFGSSHTHKYYNHGSS